MIANDERKQTAIDMLMDGAPLEKIKKYSRLAEDVIRNLALKLKVNIS